VNPVNKALWFVESHLAQDIDLKDVAASADVTRHYIVRAFGAAMGRSVMAYARSRRLTEAARTLAKGAPDILSVALDCGYGSHEAFTRAFRDEFGMTPEQVRNGGKLGDLALTEPIKMSEDEMADLPAPDIVDGETLLIAGMAERYDDRTAAGIPAQWNRFAPHIGHMPGQMGGDTFGVCCNGDDDGNIDYITGVTVRDFGDLSPDYARLRIPAQRYAVFKIGAHVSIVRRAWKTVWTKWLPQSGEEFADAPFFERYDETFDSLSGNGGFEIWLPLTR
jgi:AraC family transcriptional regulator